MFHPRCKDSTSTYYEGITTLKPVTPEEMAEMERREKLEQQHSYYQNQANKNQRVADYSLDDENYRIYQHRAKQSQKKADELDKKLDETVAKSGESGIINNNEHFAKSKTKYSIEFGKISNVPSASKMLKQAYSDEFDKFVNEFCQLDNLRSVDIKPYRNDKVWGSYNDNSGVLEIYGAQGNNGIELLSKVAKQQKKNGEWSTSSYLHTFRHELGHCLQDKLRHSSTYQDSLREIVCVYENLVNKILSNSEKFKQYEIMRNYLSSYGFDSIDEFISECIAEYLNGKPRVTARQVTELIKKGL